MSVAQTVTKRLCAVGHDNLANVAGVSGTQFWYEDSMTLGTLQVLSAATGTIDSTDQLNMFAGFQKCFVVNGSSANRLWVADFVNTKLTTANIGGTSPFHYPLPGTILTGGTSAAKMIVDFVTVANGASVVYGYTTTTTPFTAGGEAITGDNSLNPAMGSRTDVSAAVSFTASAASEARPFWYAWTAFAGGANYYGALPSKAYLGCLYRSRAVLSGNPESPYQWYMSRMSNPWDWAALGLDAQSAVRGGEGVAGQAKSIITALAPYQDDYLIIGCESCVLKLSGDPAAGGSLDLVTDATGIFGANAWCWDDAKNFYFMGNNGIYLFPAGGQTLPQNLTANLIPDLVKGLQLSSAVHRVTMCYDNDRYGIIISKTRLSDGANENYWYDLRTKGFFPETYPDTCGVYSAVHYNSISATQRGLILGCTDGYLRTFDKASKNDVETSTEAAIDAYVTTGPARIGASEDMRGRIESLTLVLGGDATASETEQSSPVDYEIFTGDAAEDVISQVKGNTGALISGTTSTGEGRKPRIRTRSRGVYMATRISNKKINQTFALEKVAGTISPAGTVD